MNSHDAIQAKIEEYGRHIETLKATAADIATRLYSKLTDSSHGFPESKVSRLEHYADIMDLPPVGHRDIGTIDDIGRTGFSMRYGEQPSGYLCGIAAMARWSIQIDSGTVHAYTGDNDEIVIAEPANLVSPEFIDKMAKETVRQWLSIIDEMKGGNVNTGMGYHAIVETT